MDESHELFSFGLESHELFSFGLESHELFSFGLENNFRKQTAKVASSYFLVHGELDST